MLWLKCGTFNSTINHRKKIKQEVKVERESFKHGDQNLGTDQPGFGRNSKEIAVPIKVNHGRRQPVKCGVYEQDGKICSTLDRTAVFFDNMNLSKSNSKSTSVVHGTKLKSMTMEILDDYAKMEANLLERGLYDFTAVQYWLVKSIFKESEVHEPFFMARQRILPYLFRNEKNVIETFGALVKKCRFKKGLIVLDMGMNEGFFTMLSYAAGCTVYGFEPQVGCIGKIVSSIQKSLLPGVAQIMNVGVGNTHGGKLKVAGKGCDSGNSFQPKYAKRHAVERAISVVALDKLFPVEEIEILHIDVEGFEPYVMEGAKRMLLEGRVKNLFYEEGGGYKTTWTKAQKDFIKQVRSIFKECKLVMAGNYFCSNTTITPLQLSPILNRVEKTSGAKGKYITAAKKKVCGCTHSQCGTYFCEDDGQQDERLNGQFYKLVLEKTY